jgi:hypothetical protein
MKRACFDVKMTGWNLPQMMIFCFMSPFFEKQKLRLFCCS